jgi:Family of unknown function (DUF5763)
MAKIPCKGKTKVGAPCRAPAGPNGLCFFHAHPEQAHTLGQIGGKKNRSQLPEPPAAGSLSAGGLRDILGEAIRDVRSRKISPRTAGALAQLCNSAHRILQSADLEARLARLERQLTELEGRKSLDTDASWSPVKEEDRGGADADPADVQTPGIGEGGEDGKA